ncbi:hypothetical protein FJZ36_03320 [Candidatus Poribacteria bacterium]|nr:hypothetical protein [Candidatus Poribacteria bacterium]
MVSLRPRVEEDVVIGACDPPGNGAGPYWCYGSPLVFRHGSMVLVQAMEASRSVPPLCNTRARLFAGREGSAWELAYADGEFRQREPCPLVGFRDGRLFLSANPSTRPAGAQYEACEPQLLEFSAGAPYRQPVIHRPIWEPGARFTDHSYRGVAADGERGELLLLNIDAPTGDQFWSWRGAEGNWAARGRIAFPIRSCYPQVALRRRAGHVMAIGDIVEPVEAWRRFKFESTGSQWDYVFRRLFYTWTPDVTSRGFAAPIEIDSVEDTAGHILNLDMWIGSDSSAHLLYIKRPVQSAAMRDRFFLDTALTAHLCYVVVRDGAVVESRELLSGGENLRTPMPGYARFHATPEGLWVVCQVTSRVNNGSATSGNWMLPVDRDGEPITLPLAKPFSMFFTAPERGGSMPSYTLDLFGPGDGTDLRYARVSLSA